MRTIEKSGPWAWQEKAALRKIREAFDQTRNVASALAIYNALTQVASDKGSERFETTHAWLAGLSGFGDRTVRERLPELEEIGLIKIFPTKGIRGPSTYELLPFGNGCLATGNECRTLGNGKNPPLPPSEEKKKRKSSKDGSATNAEQPGIGSAFKDRRDLV